MKYLFRCPVCGHEDLIEIAIGKALPEGIFHRTLDWSGPERHGITHRMRRVYEPANINYGAHSTRYDAHTTYQLKHC
jgi:hypothetical protein